MKCKLLSEKTVAQFEDFGGHSSHDIWTVNDYIWHRASRPGSLEALDSIESQAGSDFQLADSLLAIATGYSWGSLKSSADSIGEDTLEFLEDVVKTDDDCPDPYQSLREFYDEYSRESNTPAEISVADEFFKQLICLTPDEVIVKIASDIQDRISPSSEQSWSAGL